jgi:hypothetical protein
MPTAPGGGLFYSRSNGYAIALSYVKQKEDFYEVSITVPSVVSCAHSLGGCHGHGSGKHTIRNEQYCR